MSAPFRPPSQTVRLNVSAPRERQLFLHLLELCPLINKLDIDIGYHYALRNVSLFPTALRTLTLRNVDATSTLEIVNSLPLLTDLTLRLVL